MCHAHTKKACYFKNFFRIFELRFLKHTLEALLLLKRNMF